MNLKDWQPCWKPAVRIREYVEEVVANLSHDHFDFLVYKERHASSD